jgi:hypothetical protein
MIKKNRAFSVFHFSKEEKMERIARIKRMEEHFDRVQAALSNPETASLEQVQDFVAKLAAYYETDWRQDYEADERGELPADLKRGVLSQDELYNLLMTYENRF